MSQPGWYPDPQGGGSLRWWNGQHWTEHLNPQPPVPARRRAQRQGAAQEPDPRPAMPAQAPTPPQPAVQDASWGVQHAVQPVDATVRGLLLHADEHVIAYGATSLAWAHVEWTAYWAAGTAPEYGSEHRPPYGAGSGIQWIFQAGRHPFHGGPRVEVIVEDPGVTVHGPAASGRPDGAAERVWQRLVELGRTRAEPRLVEELVKRVLAGESIDVAQGLTVHPGGVRGDRVSLSWSAISDAVIKEGRVWIRQSTNVAPVLYVPQQNPNAVLIPALLTALKARH
ncbi:DUF2510 domain-containing protein [Actinomadura sp. 9N407]|uniref:DUF2510 domain-containing protein n=1 Tax=Actinomadura sp. 9N407 TaxID=3375154 RepID=UPI0037B9BC1E